MLHYDGIDINEGVDLAKSNKSKQCMICHYWVLNHGFKLQDFVSYGCHDLIMLYLNITIIVKNVDYCCVNHNISESEAIDLLENVVLKNRRYV